MVLVYSYKVFMLWCVVSVGLVFLQHFYSAAGILYTITVCKQCARFATVNLSFMFVIHLFVYASCPLI